MNYFWLTWRSTRVTYRYFLVDHINSPTDSAQSTTEHSQLDVAKTGPLEPQIHSDFNEAHAETKGPSRPRPLHNSSTGDNSFRS